MWQHRSDLVHNWILDFFYSESCDGQQNISYRKKQLLKRASALCFKTVCPTAVVAFMQLFLCQKWMSEMFRFGIGFSRCVGSGQWTTQACCPDLFSPRLKFFVPGAPGQCSISWTAPAVLSLLSCWSMVVSCRSMVFLHLRQTEELVGSTSAGEDYGKAKVSFLDFQWIL